MFEEIGFIHEDAHLSERSPLDACLYSLRVLIRGYRLINDDTQWLYYATPLRVCGLRLDIAQRLLCILKSAGDLTWRIDGGVTRVVEVLNRAAPLVASMRCRDQFGDIRRGTGVRLLGSPSLKRSAQRGLLEGADFSKLGVVSDASLYPPPIATV